MTRRGEDTRKVAKAKSKKNLKRCTMEIKLHLPSCVSAISPSVLLQCQLLIHPKALVNKNLQLKAKS